MKRIVFLMALSVVALAGCLGGPSEELNATEIKALMVDSAASLEAYQFQIDMEQNMEFVNLSSNDTQGTDVALSTKGVGAVNLPARALKMSTTSIAVPENESEAPSTTEAVTYFMNDTMYMLLDGNWTKLTMPSPEEIWDQQNMVKHQVELLNSSELELLGSEKVDGDACYKIKVVPDMETYTVILSEQMGSAMPFAYMNLTQLFNESEMSWISWITEDGHYLRKNQMDMKMTITPEVMGLPEEAVGNFEMRVDMLATMLFADFNENVEITLPEDAKNAAPLPIFPLQLAPATS